MTGRFAYPTRPVANQLAGQGHARSCLGRRLKMIPAHPFVNNSKGQAMDEATTRDHIQKHADAVVRGDTDAFVADFTEDASKPLSPPTN